MMLLGKEPDKESGLGDHGVRKYDNISGRFLSIDPLWEKYLSWTPYQYAGNNPVNAYDVDGKDIIVLYDVEGANLIPFAPAAHLANLIGPDENGGWDYYSKDGVKNGGPFGESKSEHTKFESFDDFLNSTDKFHIRYDYGYRIETTTQQDKAMKDASKAQIESYYSFTSNSCADTPSAALKAVNKASGTKTEEVKNKDGEYYKRKYGNPIPHGRYKDIKNGNPKGQEYDLNRMRTEGVPNS